PLLQQTGGKVIIRCQPALLQLLAQYLDNQLMPEGGPLPAFDCYVPLLSLPGILGATPTCVPAPVPYLRPAPQLVNRWRGELPKRAMRVGIAWQGSPTYPSDWLRSI